MPPLFTSSIDSIEIKYSITLQTLFDGFRPLTRMLQQEQVDSVEYYALQATERVEYGGQQLLKGTVSRRKAKKVYQLHVYLYSLSKTFSFFTRIYLHLVSVYS